MGPISVAWDHISTPLCAEPSRPFASWRPDRMTLLLPSAGGMCGREMSRGQFVYSKLSVGCRHGQGMAAPFLPAARGVLAPRESVDLKLMTRGLLRAATRGG